MDLNRESITFLKHIEGKIICQSDANLMETPKYVLNNSRRKKLNVLF